MILPCKPLMLEASSYLRYKDQMVLDQDIDSGIAIVPIHGVLTKRSNILMDFMGQISYEDLQQKINVHLEDKTVHTILLDIDSPGGEISGLFELCDMIYNARSIKPIIALCNDDAFSAAYAIASSCNKVYINQTSGVGSIGVIAYHVDQSEFDKKEGFRYTALFAGKHKNDMSPHEKQSESSMAPLQSEINRLYDMFSELVAKNRGIDIEHIKATEAGLFYGSKAIDERLADGLMTKQELTNSIKQERNFNVTETIKTEEVEPLKRSARDLQEMARLCKLAKMPEQLAECIEQDLSLDDTREFLIQTMAAKEAPAIQSVVTKQATAMHPLTAIAQKRKEQQCQ